MSVEERTELASLAFEIKQWLKNRMETAVANPPTGIIFDDDIGEWINRPDVRSYEADLFRRLAIGYHMMQPQYRGGQPLMITMDDTLEEIESALIRRIASSARSWHHYCCQNRNWVSDHPGPDYGCMMTRS